MFGISAGEFIVLVAVAAVVLGPERLPDYARQLARLIREMRNMAQGAGAKVREEMGPEFDEIDWRKLDPRQYDPRRIVREALSDAFDPDDPLGLNDDLNGLREDFNLKSEKPVSRGGPAQATAAARRRAAERSAAEKRVAAAKAGPAPPASPSLEKKPGPEKPSVAKPDLEKEPSPAPVPEPPAVAYDADAT